VQSSETATAYLHRVHRHMARARFGRSGNSRLKRIAKRGVAPIYWYVQPIVQAIAEVRSRYRAVRTDYGIGVLDQLTGCVAFTTSFRASPSSYFDYRLFLRDRWQRRSEYLYYDELWPVLEWLNRQLGADDAADLVDKRRFHDRAIRAGLPTIAILAEFDRGAMVRDCSPVDLPASDLFSNLPTNGAGWAPDCGIGERKVSIPTISTHA
jgi:hypothetical protein